MVGWVNEETDVWMNEEIDEWLNEEMNWMGGWMDE